MNRIPDRVLGEVRDSLRLSLREMQIVRGFLDDQTEQAIAERIGISPKTVHTYVGRLYRKLSVRSRAGLVARIFLEYVGTNTKTHGAGCRDLRHEVD